ncbi:MAG TPA: leucyl/phenylalanyl-tRNA--protein transferase [Piscirickettsiaceae bacterium]|nr:leucyl/phenylalanyl-tRNA--protein transferase [Piscirickettsiaceae bacterium]
MLPFLPEQPIRFPPTHQALSEPNGLLAAGGALTPEWVLAAYRRGIFPWYSPGEPILWWSPDPRCVLPVDQVHISRSLRKTMKKPHWSVRFDTAFAQVIRLCAQTPRRGQDGTWIDQAMVEAYSALHQMGYAHSVEVFWHDELVGGLYGVQIGRMFFGESMFSLRPDASKIALVHLCHQLQQWGFEFIDCQVETAHLRRMGAVLLSRHEFEHALQRLLHVPFAQQKWTDGQNSSLNACF